MLRHSILPLTLALYLVVLGIVSGANVGMAAESSADLDVTDRYDSAELVQDADYEPVSVGTITLREPSDSINPAVRDYLIVPLIHSVLHIAESSAHTVYWLRGWVPEPVLVPGLRAGLFGLALLPILATVGHALAVVSHLSNNSKLPAAE